MNDLRKETGCQFTDRIELAIVTDSPELQLAIRDNAEYITRETQTDSLSEKPLAGVAGVEREDRRLPGDGILAREINVG